MPLNNVPKEASSCLGAEAGSAITEYHAKYYAYELTRRCPADSLQKLAASLSDAQVDLNPHQIDAALFAFKSPLSKGAILADEVGLGKTIEAGIILSQKWAERTRKLLIIVPSSLRKQWSQELLDKFFLPSFIIETASFKQEIKKGNLNPFDRNDIVICSYNFARLKDVYISQVKWDLVVIDEAHRLRNVYKPANKIANAIKNSVSHAPKVLLTATPLQNSLLELYGLVSVIDDYTFGDLKSFKGQFARLTNENNFDDLKARLKTVCKRTLRKQVLEYVKYTNRIPITQEFVPTESEQNLYNLVSDYLQRPNLFALPPSQRHLMTLILRKLLASSTYAISGTLEALSNKLEVITSSHAVEVLQEFNVEELLVNDYETIDELEEEWLSDDEEPEAQTKTYTHEEIELIKNEIKLLKEFQKLASSIVKNSKGEVLLTALKRGFEAASEKGSSRKAIIFTESTRTQKYLFNVLENTDYAGKIVLFNGSNTDAKSKEVYAQWVIKNQGTDKITNSKSADMRAALVDYFRDEATIMIATEAAAEGINLQFCSLVVNYDLPWNPQRIEQRIGRCHRYGQKHDVVVVNFLNKNNAADQRVYQILSEKFRLFDGVFGASDEVLGSIESGVDFEKRIARIYQTCRTLEEIQASFDDLQKELETEIDEKMRMTRKKLLENFDEEVHEKLRVSLNENTENLTKYETWLWELTRCRLSSYADFNGREMSFILNKNPFKEDTIPCGQYKLGKYIQDAHLYRIGHPLAQNIISQYRSKKMGCSEIIFDYSNTPKKISILEPLVGETGWLTVYNLTISSFETEDYVLLCGFTDKKLELDQEQCRRLFSLNSRLAGDSRFTGNIKTTMSDKANQLQTEILKSNSERNASFFDAEMAKLDKWAEDVKSSLEIELKELDKEIKTLKTESKKIPTLEDKLKTQKHIKELEKKRNSLRLNLYESQDEVDNRKDGLINEIEARMEQKVELEELFTIRWRLI